MPELIAALSLTRETLEILDDASLRLSRIIADGETPGAEVDDEDLLELAKVLRKARRFVETIPMPLERDVMTYPLESSA